MNPNEVRRRWAHWSGEYSPAYYAYYGPDETSEVIRGTLDRFVAPDAQILEIGCGSGRHLAHLADHGFENLAGVDVNEDAFDVMAEAYPALAAEGTFYHDAIETVVGDLEDGCFDAIYSVETLQHLHPDLTWVFDELCRLTDDLLVTAEIEGEATDASASDPAVNYVDDEVPLYYRDWNRIFTERGFREVDTTPGKREPVRTFRSPTA